jgi:hypothetical protein
MNATPPLRRAPVKTFRMAAFLFLLLVGCAHHMPPATSPTAVDSRFIPQYVESVDARAFVPAGWHADPLKSSPTHNHQVWISPSGHTAYGIIHFTLPLPVGNDLALWGFLQTMQRSEGEATLIEKNWDPNLHATRFVVVGGLYMVRVNQFVRGSQGWAIYAGTLRKEKIEPDELSVARASSRLNTSDLSLSGNP